MGALAAAAVALLLAPLGTSRAAPPRARGATAVTAPRAPFVDSWAAMRERDARRGVLTGAPAREPLAPTGLAALSPLGIYNNFQGLNRPDAASGIGTAADPLLAPPDAMGAAGPSPHFQFLQVQNFQVGLYEKQEQVRLGVVSLAGFFTVVQGGVTYPRGGAFNPRVLFDRDSQRWFATALEQGAPAGSDNHLILAVSGTTNVTGIWNKYVLPLGEPGAFTTANALGIDTNGVYFGVDEVTGGLPPSLGKIAATPKAPLVAAGPALGPVFQFGGLDDLRSPRPANNQDLPQLDPRAWVIGTEPAALGPLHVTIPYRSLTWTGGVPALSPPGALPIDAYAPPPPAPANGSLLPIETGGGEFQALALLTGDLWACHGIGVDASGGTVVPGTPGARSACEWFQLDLDGPQPAIAQSGRVFDAAVVDTRFYFFPAIQPNMQRNVVMGFSGSSANEYISGYQAGRLAGDPPGTFGGITPVKAGEGPYTLAAPGEPVSRWGSYSAAALDPDCGMCLWTVQPYAGAPNNLGSNWGTWIAQMKPPPPTINDPVATVVPGQSNVTLELTGGGLFDGGPTFPNVLSVQLLGGTVNGIANLVTTYQDPEHALVTFDVSPFASPGPREIFLTNPDALTARVPGGVTVLAPALGRLVAPREARFGRVPVGGSVTRVVTFRNRSANQPLLVTPFPPTGPFELADAAAVVIPPAGTADLPVRFSPAARGSQRGLLRVTSTDPRRPTAKVELVGVGR